MASINRAILIGNVGKEPESRQAGEKTVIKFTLATTEKYTDRNGQQVENTEWHNIEWWVKNTNILQYLHKGTQVYVEGAIATDSWDGNDGQKHYQTKIKANTVQLLGGKPQGQSAPQPQYNQPAPPPQYQQQAPPQYPPQYQQPQGFQQTGQFPQHPVNQPYPPQYQQGVPPQQYSPGVDDLP